MPDESPPDHDSDIVLPTPKGTNLRTWERWVAGVFGFLGAAVGGTAIFVTDNQAGTTAMLLIGAIFTLMAVQGTAVRKAAKDSVEMYDREVVERATKEAKDALEEKDYLTARAIIETAKEENPGISHDPALEVIDYAVYEKEVHQAIVRVMPKVVEYGYTVMTDGYSDGDTFDFVIVGNTQLNDPVLVETLYSSTLATPTPRIRRAKHRIRATGHVGVIISNRYMTNAAISELGFDRDETDVQFVLWRNILDDRSLGLALSRLLPPPARPF